MRHVLTHVVPWFIVACTVDTPIVEGDDDERLGNELGAWCQSMCVRLDECGAPITARLCLDNCLEYFHGIRGQGWPVQRRGASRDGLHGDRDLTEELDSLEWVPGQR